MSGSRTSQDYSNAVECRLCSKQFHAFRRKHKCKSCGYAVCSNCYKNQERSVSSNPHSEMIRVCDRCFQEHREQETERLRGLDIERNRARQLAAIELEEKRRIEAEQALVEQKKKEHEAKLAELTMKYFGSVKDKSILPERRHSFSDVYNKCDAAKERVVWLTNVITRAKDLAHIESLQTDKGNEFNTPTLVDSVPSDVMKHGTVKTSSIDPSSQISNKKVYFLQAIYHEECGICLDEMVSGNAIYTTGCGHSFHYSCLREIQKSDSSNYDKCPYCRATMHEMQLKMNCSHPRVRQGHRFCRDCGGRVEPSDVKKRENERPPASNGPSNINNTSAGGATYRAGAQGALVRCPQCSIQMRVLPHMYNMRVACPSGHMFQVQVANQSSVPYPPASRSSGSRYTAHSGYPGARS